MAKLLPVPHPHTTNAPGPMTFGFDLDKGHSPIAPSTQTTKSRYLLRANCNVCCHLCWASIFRSTKTCLPDKMDTTRSHRRELSDATRPNFTVSCKLFKFDRTLPTAEEDKKKKYQLDCRKKSSIFKYPPRRSLAAMPRGRHKQGG